MIESLGVQISGKYHPDNIGLFALRKNLLNVGFSVSFPAGDAISAYPQDFAITTEQEAITPFHRTEIDFLRAVKSNAIEIVDNRYGGSAEGYIGESAAIEMAAAMGYGKPIILLREPVFGQKAPSTIVDIIQKRQDLIHLLELDVLTPSELQALLLEVAAETPDYQLLRDESVIITHEIVRLCRDYRSAWKDHNAKTK
jgi:hypothetical protein